MEILKCTIFATDNNADNKNNSKTLKIPAAVISNSPATTFWLIKGSISKNCSMRGWSIKYTALKWPAKKK